MKPPGSPAGNRGGNQGIFNETVADCDGAFGARRLRCFNARLTGHVEAG
jgi:hypothetical protein